MATKEAFADATAGALSSLCALLLFYPIDVIKINLQADGRKTSSNVNGKNAIASKECKSTQTECTFLSLLREMISKKPSTLPFIKSLFRGLHYKILHTTASSFTYFFIYSWIQSNHRLRVTSNAKKSSKFVGKYKPSTSTRLLLSAIAAMVNVTLTLPLDVLASRSQTANRSSPSNQCNTTSGDIQKEVELHGEMGCLPVTNPREENKDAEEKKNDDAPESNTLSSQELMENVWKNVNQFDTEDSETEYDTAHEDQDQSSHGDSGGNDDSVGECQKEHESLDYCSSFNDEYRQTENYEAKCGDGMASSCRTKSAETMCIRPLFRVDSWAQPFPKQLVRTLSLLNRSKRKDLYKFAYLWRGIRPSLLLCSNPSINFTVFDSIKDIVLKNKDSANARLTMGEAFCMGLVAKFAATMATYPLIRAKVMLMVAKKKNCDSVDFASEDTMVGLLQEMWQNGSKDLYKGCSLQLFHTLLKSAILMMAREKIGVTTRRLILS